MFPLVVNKFDNEELIVIGEELFGVSQSWQGSR